MAAAAVASSSSSSSSSKLQNGHGSAAGGTSKLSQGQLKKLKKARRKAAAGTTGSAEASGGTAESAAADTHAVKQEPEAVEISQVAEKENEEATTGRATRAATRTTAKSRATAAQLSNMYDDDEDADEKKPSTSALADGSDSMDIDGLPDEYKAIFAKFEVSAEDLQADDGEDAPKKAHIYYSDDEAQSEEDEEVQQLSKRKMRKVNRLSVAELKRLVKRPDVVEWVDVTALDARMLVHLKSYRNSIAVPAHWSAKRDYLSGKKGIEKPPFQLPSFIADTGIATQRDAVKEKEDGQSLKQKSRERVQPKMGKIDIDYQKLHDAFFKFQTKPSMSDFGEMYYEGKEFETHLKEKRPGDISKELKEALSIPPLAPPPWLIAMQRFGPPPSYPNLRVPGLNAPIPEGAQWGFHPGGWGKPPTDEFNRPLYGDVFGVQIAPDVAVTEGINKEIWGELEPDLDESEEEDEEEEMEQDDDEAAGPEGMQTPATIAGGMETPSGFASVASTVPGGMETPDFLELRKRREQTSDTEYDGQPRQLYQVLPEHQTAVRGVLGSERGYDTRNIGTGNVPILGVDERGQKRRAAEQAGRVDIALDAAEVEGMSEAELRSRFESARSKSGAAGAGQGGREDFSDFVAEETAKRRKLEQQRQQKRGQKDNFKF